MRFALFFVLGLFIWSGTVSIKYPQQSSTVTASSGSTCSGQPHEERLMAYLKVGTITRIFDNGRILTIGLSPQWGNLSPQIQEQAYNTIVCYAQALNRPFQFQASQHM